MKKIYILVLTVALLLCVAVAYAESLETQLLSLLKSDNLDQNQLAQMISLARNITNDELRPLNDNQDFYKETDEMGRQLNGKVLQYYWVLAYGEKPHGTYDKSQDEHRYLGYTANGESYTNWLFRPDFSDTIDINNVNWIEKPEKDEDVKYFVTQIMGEGKELQYNNFDGLRSSQKYREHIAVGLYLLSIYLPDYYRQDTKNLLDRDWENYVHILQPPSKYMFGTGRMFRWMPDGTMRYMDVPLLPDYLLQFDLSAFLKEESYKGNPGSVIESTATFALNNEAFYEETAKLRLCMKTAAGETELPFAPVDPAKKMNGNQYTFQPGEKQEVKFSFTVPGEPSEIIARIDRVSKMRYWIEKNKANNEDRAAVVSGRYDVKAEVYPAQPSFTSINGGNTPVRFVVRISRKDDTPGVIPVPAVMSGPGGNYPVNPRLGPGESREYPYEFPGTPGCYTVEADAWPEGLADAYPGDNHASAEACVEYKEFKVDSKIRGDLIDVGGW